MNTPKLTEYVVVYADMRHVYDMPWDEVSWKGGDTLLVLKDRPPWQAGRLNMLGGKLEPGETALEAAVRELKEESGLDATSPEYMGRIEGTKSLIHCVRVSVNPHQPIQPREGETEVVDWYYWETVEQDKRLMPNLRITIPLMKSQHVSGWVLEDKTPSVPGEAHTVYLTLPGKDGWPHYFKVVIGTPNNKLCFIELKEKYGEEKESDRGQGSLAGTPDCNGPGQGGSGQVQVG